MPFELVARNGLIALNNSIVTGSLNVTNGITGSLLGTSSLAVQALTASSADAFNVRGTLTATTLVVQTITSSTDFVTGSTRFGSLLSNTHVFSGSVTMNPGGLFVSSSGLVGIGTTSPSFLLNIYGSNAATVYQTPGTGTGSANGFYVGHTGNISYVWNYNNFPLVLAVNNAEVMRITGSNVGIGTTAPKTKLDVAGAGGKISITNTGTSDYGELQYYEGSTLKADIWVNGSSQTNYAGGNSFNIYQASNAPMAFYTNGANERMRIEGGGNIGIGSTSPSQKLDVVGIIKASGNSNSLMFDNRSAAGNTWEWYSQGSVGSSFAGLYKSYNTAGTVLAVTDTGLVGIGTTNPAGQLSGTIGLSIVNATNAALGLSNGTNHWLNYLSGTTYRIWNNSVSEVVTILLNGNVGIGTTSPGYKLDVSGNGRFTSTLIAESNIDLTGDLRYQSNAGFGIKSLNGTRILEVYNAGINFPVGITGTSATFSSTVTVASPFTIKATNPYIQWQDAAGTRLGYIQHATNLVMSADTGDIALTTTSGQLWVKSGGNVGISTSSPAYKLDVNGNSSVVDSFKVRNASYLSSYHTSLRSDTGAVGVLQLGNNNDNYILAGNTGVNGYLVIRVNCTAESITSGTEAMRITAAGNVGIGTTNPIYKLEVNGTIGLSGVLFAQKSSNYNILYEPAGGAAIYLGNASDPGNYYDNTSHNFRSRGGSTNYVTINSSGNVGINTTSPSYVLDVFSNSTTYTSRFYQPNSSTSAYNAVVWSGAHTSAVGYVTTGGSTAGNTYLRDTFAIGTQNAYGFAIVTNDTGRLYINSSGNVGIGTTSPGELLDVYKSTNGNTSINVRNPSGGTSAYAGLAIGNDIGVNSGGIIVFGSGATSFSSPYNPNGTYIYSNRAGGVAINSESSAPLYLATNNTIRLYINSGGNVGIGTTSPAYKLDVNGIGGFSGNVYAGGANGVFVNSGRGVVEANGSSQAILGLTIGNAAKGYLYHNGTNLELYTYTGNIYLSNSSGNILTINGANVGIGTTSPYSRLDVNNGNIRMGEILNSASAYIGKQYSVNSNFYSSVQFYSTSGEDAIVFNTHLSGVRSGEVMRITGAGNIGIGTTSPAKTLTVVNTAEQLRLSYDGSSTYTDFRNDSAGGLLINTSAGYIINYIGGSEKMRITSGGNVGIANTTPQYRLDVNGGSGFAASFGGQISPGVFSGIHFGYLEPSNTAYRKSALVFERTDNHGQGGNASGKIYMLLDNRSANSATSLAAAVMTWDTDASATLGSARVGIGSTSPAYTLDVNGAINAATDVNLSNGTLYISAGSGTSYSSRLSTVYNYPYIETYLDSYAGPSYEGRIYFRTNSGGGGLSTKMTITNDGNVGIGTTSPSYKLDVRGNSLFYNSSADTYLRIQGNSSYDAVLELRSDQGGIASEGFQMWYVNNVGDVHFATTYNDNAASMHFHTKTGGDKSTSNERLTILGGGNVGINTTSPGYKLHVAGNGYFSTSLEVSGQTWAYTGVQMYRQGQANTGISWYNSSYYNWQEYMASAGATSCGPNGNLTAPGGLYQVSSWALRSRMEGVGSYGWLWEVGSGGGGGATASSVMELDVYGNLRLSADVVAYASDGRLKTNVKVIENAVAKVKAIRGVEYDWLENIYEDYGFKPTKMHEVGVIAQEVETVLPEAVLTAPFNGAYKDKHGIDPNFLTVKYDRMVPLLIEAIKEQQKQIDELKYLLQNK
jgi:hypothetical protein